MKLPFLYKNISSTPCNHSSSCSSSSSSSSLSSSSSSWPWPSCNQNPKTLSFRNTIPSKNPNLFNDETELAPATFSSSSSAASEPPEESESIENVIGRLKSSKRLIFEPKGESNSILEEANKPRNDGFMLLSLESKDPYSDFKRSMEEMVDTHNLHQDWRCLEKLLYWFLKVNAKSSHGYIFAAFVDLLVGLALKCQNDVVSSSTTATDTVTVTVTETSSTSCSCSNDEGSALLAGGYSPLSPLSFYTTSFSSDSDEASLSRPVPRVTDEIGGVCCLSSLLENGRED